MSASTTIKPRTKVLDLCMYPFIKARLSAAFAEVRKLNPNISGYVGHDGERMFFQEHANATPYSTTIVPATPKDDHFA